MELVRFEKYSYGGRLLGMTVMVLDSSVSIEFCLWRYSLVISMKK